MLDCDYIYYDKKPKITEEDRKLKWLPRISVVKVCPHCNGAVGLYGTWRQVGPSPWMEEYEHQGFICYDCKKVMSQQELKTAWLKSYSAYDLYLYRKMTQEEYNWFGDNDIDDIRKFPKTN